MLHLRLVNRLLIAAIVAAIIGISLVKVSPAVSAILIYTAFFVILFIALAKIDNLFMRLL